MAHLKDIAEAAGVSIRTVSRALKDSGYVAAEKRDRIRKIAKKLGYRPNRIAQGLRTRRSYQVSLLAWGMNEQEVARTVTFQRVLQNAGYLVDTVFASEPDGRKVADGLLEEMIGWQPAGVGVLPHGLVDLAPIAHKLREREVPYVVVGGAQQPADIVYFDRSQGTHDAVRYLWEQGRRRIAYLGTNTHSPRAEGYRRAIEALGQEPIWLRVRRAEPRQLERAAKAAEERLTGRAAQMVADTATVQQFAYNRAVMVEASRVAREAAPRFAELRPRPDAVQCFSDVYASGFLAGLLDLGIAVPDEVAVVGFDNRLAASLCYPALTSVVPPNLQVGVGAAEVLLKKIAGDPPPAGGWSRTLKCGLVVRQSA